MDYFKTLIVIGKNTKLLCIAGICYYFYTVETRSFIIKKPAKIFIINNHSKENCQNLYYGGKYTDRTYSIFNWIARKGFFLW